MDRRMMRRTRKRPAGSLLPSKPRRPGISAGHWRDPHLPPAVCTASGPLLDEARQPRFFYSCRNGGHSEAGVNVALRPPPPQPCNALSAVLRGSGRVQSSYCIAHEPCNQSGGSQLRELIPVYPEFFTVINCNLHAFSIRSFRLAGPFSDRRPYPSNGKRNGEAVPNAGPGGTRLRRLSVAL